MVFTSPLHGGKHLFDWDKANREHVRRHGIESHEAEEALLDPRRLGRPAYAFRGEKRRAYLGATTGGRILFVVVTRRVGELRVVSARESTQAERHRYRRRGN
jgi:uncharacterized protein